MTITDPIPDTQWGRGNWQDYINNWREKDAEYLQARTILRYHNAGDRTTDWGATPSFGQITYNETAIALGGGNYADRPEMYSKQHAKWVPLMMLDNITSTKDDSAGVALSHKLAGGKGVIFEPARTQMDNPIWIMGGVLGVDGTGVTVKTGAKTVKLTTDGANLISDSPISAPGLITGGTLSVTGAFTAGSISTPGTATLANITMSGTLTGGVINGSSGTVGGVAMASNIATASAGFVAQAGYHYGDGGAAYMRYRNPSGGALGSSYFQTNATDAYVGGNNFLISASTDTWIQGGKAIRWYDTGGVHRAWIAPTIVSGGDPGAGNYPDGTIWIVP